MKKRCFALALSLALLLVCFAPAADAAPDLVFLCINDTFVGSLTSSNMPLRINNNMYISYRYLARVKALKYRYDDDLQTLRVYNSSASLIFDLGKAVTYDQDGKIYSYLAERRGAVLYIPIEFICRIFGFYYSQFTTELGTVVRINSVMSRFDDQQIAENNRTVMQTIHDAYYAPAEPDDPEPTAPTEPDPPPVTPTEPDPVEPEPPVHKTIYPMFCGALDSSTGDILDALRQHGAGATFFLPLDGLREQGDLLRRIICEGHALGLAVTSVDPVGEAEELNDLLSSMVVRRSRLVYIGGGSASLTKEQREALHAAGYRLWDPSFDLASEDVSAYAFARAANAALEDGPRIAALGLTSSAVVASALETVLARIDANEWTASRIDDWTTPVNASNDYS